MFQSHSLSARRFSISGLLLLAIGTFASADVIYLRDGTVLHGQVVTARKTIADSSGVYELPAGDGVYAVYDGCRIVVFSKLQLDPARLPEITETRASLLKLTKPRIMSPAKQVPPGKIDIEKPFDPNGRRTLRITNDNGFYRTDQILSLMTPYQLRISSLDYAWAQNFLVAEMDREMIKSLIMTFDVMKNEKDPLEKQMRLYRFVTEAKWYDESEKLLVKIEKEFPNSKDKDRIDKAREGLRQLQGESMFEEAERAISAGQLRFGMLVLSRIPKPGLDANLSVKTNTLRVRVENVQARMEKARHYLRVLPDSALGNCAEVLVEAAAIIRDEVHAEAMDRLQPFVDLAEQAENARKQGREPVDKAEQLLARAVTGWLLGAAAAEGKPEVARKLWRARQFATTYVRTHTTRMRHALLESYEKSEPTELEELGRIINLLPPAEPDDDFTVKEPMDRKTSLPNGNRGPVDYRVQLPLEYQHGRPHPLFVVLPNENENLTKTVGRYRYEAMRNGYILVAADWSGGFGAAYGYSSDEHLRVLDVIRDVRLRYNVDSDRIILGGFGEGANAAWDIGLSHPDLFAAIVPIAAQPKANVLLALWPNCAYTPVYAVTGEMMGYATRNINRVITDCVAKSYPCLHVVYRGRGYEWYSAELATAFEWMNKRKRLSPFPEIGRWPFDDRLGTSMCSIRQTDNRFWWLSTDAIKEMHMLDSKPNSNVTPARMQAVVKANNQVVVATWGLKQVTVWFGLGMIDFTRPVTIKLTGYRDNPNVWDNGKKPLKMSLSLMMEDLYERGDKTRLYVAQVRLSP